MRVPRPIVLVPVRDEDAAESVRRTIEAPLSFSAPLKFPGVGEIRGPVAKLHECVGPRQNDGWHLWTEWIEEEPKP